MSTKISNANDDWRNSSLLLMGLSIFSSKYYFKMTKPEFSRKEDAYSAAIYVSKKTTSNLLNVSLLIYVISAMLYLSHSISFIAVMLMVTFFDIVIVKALSCSNEFTDYKNKNKTIDWIEDTIVTNKNYKIA